MTCTHCGEKKKFEKRSEITVKGKNRTWICIGGVCKVCGVHNFEDRYVAN